MFKRKSKTLQEQVESQRKKLRRGQMLYVFKVIFLFLGVSGGLSYLATNDNDTVVNRDVLIENTAILYIREYFDSEEMIVDNITINNISYGDLNVVDCTFELNSEKVTADVILNNDLVVVNELVISQAIEKEPYRKEVDLKTAKNLTDVEKASAKKFVESYFSSLNLNNATIFYEQAPMIADNTSYDISSLEMIDSGITSENLIAVFIRIDYVYLNEEQEEIYREKHDVEITYNSDSKIIQKIEY
ncbi:hypothetical protein RZE82_07050 [Mollicutes bacterium LVI A0039]|nr:hypothetical protein RZE82_07050 [Mollicutes bacterium LVI A0039]